MPQSKQLESKKKQFSARKLHSRSASIGRGLNKIGRITSSDDLNVHQRPVLNRSKSSDGMTARRSRSATRLTSLQPLTDTHHHHHHHNQRKVVIDLPKDESDESENEIINNTIEEVERFSDEEASTIIEEPKILSYKAPPQFSHTLVQPGSSFSQEPPMPKIDSDLDVKLSQITENLKLDTEEPLKDSPPAPRSQESKESKELAQYYQNMILSQSTGAIRAFSDQPFQNSLLNLNRQNHIEYIHSNDKISSINSQNYSNIKNSNNSLKQFTVNPSNLATSHESSMLSFRAEPGLALTSLPSKDGTPNNFNSFIKNSNTNIETRTQQKLWLQRESSLLDLSMLNSSNPQIRREFERMSREYLNARRFSNPVIDSVKRISIENKSIRNNGLLDKFKTVKTEVIQNELLKLWFVNDTPNNNNNHQNVYKQNRPLMITKPHSDHQLSTSLRSPVAPTTRAVDRANHASENKRIDLSTARLQEVEQLQKLS